MIEITHQMHVPHDTTAFVSILRDDGRKVIGATRPVFSFEYDSIQFMKSKQSYFVGNEEFGMTDVQAQEVKDWLDNLHISEQAAQILADNVKHLTLLKRTDWYVNRFVETGVPIPEDVAHARATARASIRTVNANELP